MSKRIGFWTHYNGTTPRTPGTPKPAFPIASSAQAAVSTGCSMTPIDMPVLSAQAAEYRAASILAIQELHAASFARRSIGVVR